MNPLVRLIAATCTITFILYACLSHNGGLILSNSLAVTGLLMIGYGLFSSQRETQLEASAAAKTSQSKRPE